MRIGNKNPIYVEENLLNIFKFLRYHIGTHQKYKCLILADELVASIYENELNYLINYPYFNHVRLLKYNVDENVKNIDNIKNIWDTLSNDKFNKKDLLISIGGGTISDIAGFASATFKRGINLVIIPTTLLAMTDASIGGKNAINYKNIKNEIGTYYSPLFTYIYPNFLNSLPEIELLSGFTEIIKHALLNNKDSVREILNLDPRKLPPISILKKSIQFKHHIVRIDPNEKNRRKILNLGHTLGHCFESIRFSNHLPTSHGICIAWGLQYTIKISEYLLNFPPYWSKKIIEWLQTWYGKPPKIKFNDLLPYLLQDKKNSDDKITFILLYAPGKPKIHKFNIQELKKIYDKCFHDFAS